MKSVLSININININIKQQQQTTAQTKILLEYWGKTNVKTKGLIIS